MQIRVEFACFEAMAGVVRSFMIMAACPAAIGDADIVVVVVETS